MWLQHQLEHLQQQVGMGQPKDKLLLHLDHHLKVLRNLLARDRLVQAHQVHLHNQGIQDQAQVVQ